MYTFYCKKKLLNTKKDAVKFGIGHSGKPTSLYWLITNRVIGNLPITTFSPYLFLEFIKKILKKVNIHQIQKIVAKLDTGNISYRYTVLHINRPVLFGADNQGNHQNFRKTLAIL